MTEADAFEHLGLVAEISATILGLIAVFLAISRSDGKFSAADRHFVQALVLSSAFAVVFALLPSALSFYLTEGVWRASFIIAGFFGFSITIIMAYTQFRMPKEEAASVNVLWHVFPWTLGTLATVAMAWALTTGDYEIGNYVIAMTSMIGLSLSCFIAIVFRRFF